MDRYLYINQNKSLELREKYKSIQLQINNIIKQLEHYTNYSSSSLKLNDCLNITNLYLDELIQSNQGDIVAMNNTKQLITNLHNNVTTHISTLTIQLNELKNELTHVYDSLQSCPYRLFASLIHDGSEAGQGHYYSYIKNMSTNTWMKYNDVQVTPVDESIVWNESYGGLRNASAYFLIYLNDSIQLPANYETTLLQYLSPTLVSEVEDDNLLFENELKQWDEKSTSPIVDAAVKQYIDLENECNQLSFTTLDPIKNDIRLKTFSHYLAITNRFELCQYQILYNILKDIRHESVTNK
jgi:hypothetical protein